MSRKASTGRSASTLTRAKRSSLHQRPRSLSKSSLLRAQPKSKSSCSVTSLTSLFRRASTTIWSERCQDSLASLEVTRWKMKESNFQILIQSRYSLRPTISKKIFTSRYLKTPTQQREPQLEASLIRPFSNSQSKLTLTLFSQSQLLKVSTQEWCTKSSKK